MNINLELPRRATAREADTPRAATPGTRRATAREAATPRAATPVARVAIERINQPEPQNVGRAFEIHNEFEGIDINKLENIITREKPWWKGVVHDPIDASTNKKTFIKNLGNYLEFFILYNKSSFGKKKEYLNYIKGLNTIINSLTESTYPINKSLINKIMRFLSLQGHPFMITYIKEYIVDNICAYSQTTDITKATPSDISCIKGMYERLVTTLKSVLLTYCLGESNPLICKPIYKEILKEIFNVNIDKTIELNKNELIQKWNTEHLDNPDFLSLNNLDEGNPNRLTDYERVQFLKNDFIQFMRNEYNMAGLLTPQIEEMINVETNNLNELGVFLNMYFGGKLNKNNKTYKINKLHKKNKSKNT